MANNNRGRPARPNAHRHNILIDDATWAWLAQSGRPVGVAIEEAVAIVVSDARRANEAEREAIHRAHAGDPEPPGATWVRGRDPDPNR